MQNRAEGMQMMGSELESLIRTETSTEYWPPATVSLNPFIESVWTNLDNGASKDALSIEGDCAIRANREHLLVMVSSILQWFVQRFIDTPPGIEPHISVRCSHSQQGAELIFQDRSRRLDKVLREHLFTPFANALPESHDSNGRARLYSSLFLAKQLVEKKYEGILEDISDAISDSANESGVMNGHRFRICFPEIHNCAQTSNVERTIGDDRQLESGTL
jgi:hypothetical protein